MQTRLKSLYSDIFRDELGTMNSIRAELLVKENALPRFHRPRPVATVRTKRSNQKRDTKAREIRYPQGS